MLRSLSIYLVRYVYVAAPLRSRYGVVIEPLGSLLKSLRS
jgi:hypothetical protein